VYAPGTVIVTVQSNELPDGWFLALACSRFTAAGEGRLHWLELTNADELPCTHTRYNVELGGA